MFEKTKRFLGFGDNDTVYVPVDWDEAADFDPGYIPSVDEPGDITEVGDIPDAEVNK